ncbi:HAD-IC family P-type ATPase [Micromonospora sp. NPDC048930]|uniref:HAD-IC family P-type ATPase n=1 Tax=Micromonospora sp. NPDC048930 TaxID=3364261 RepID=UPI0037153266
MGAAPTLLRLAAAAEHPLAGALLAAARERGLTLPPVADFTATPGRGVAATVAGRRVLVGSPALLDGLPSAPASRLVAAEQAAGRTAVVVVVDGAAAGVLGLADRARPGAAEAVAALTALTGARPVLLTGDNAGAAARLAADTGIAEVHAGLLPEDKVDRVRAHQRDGRRVLLVGDGINDAPALAAADTGVAMGRQGSDLALRTADAVLVRDDLGALPALVGLARRARRLVVANLAVAATFIVVLVAWDLVGHLPLPLGVAGHEGSTVLVGLNGLRLLSSRAWRRAAQPRSRQRRPARSPSAAG